MGSVVVERDVGTVGEPRLEVQEVARDALEVVQAIDEQEGDRLTPGNLVGALLDRLHDVSHLRRGNVSLKRGERRRRLLDRLVERADLPLMRIDRVHRDVRTERGHDAGEHNRGAALIRPDLDDRSSLGRLGECAG